MDTFQLITIKSSDPFIRGLRVRTAGGGPHPSRDRRLPAPFFQDAGSDLEGYYGKGAASIWTFWAGVPGGAGGGRGIAEGSSVPLEDILVPELQV